MTNEIVWEKNMDSAIARARTQKLPVLLFFHNPG
jgi:hypothetical protein